MCESTNNSDDRKYLISDKVLKHCKKHDLNINNYINKILEDKVNDECYDIEGRMYTKFWENGSCPAFYRYNETEILEAINQLKKRYE